MSTVIPLSAANGMDDFDTIPGTQFVGGKGAARHDLSIDFQGNPPALKAKLPNQAGCRQPFGYFFLVAIQNDLHAIFSRTACLYNRYNPQTFR